jgi:hypothetical protein
MKLEPSDLTPSRRQDSNPFGITPEELDGFVVREGWHQIRDTRTMERFLCAALMRFRALNALPADVLWANDSPTLQGTAWNALHDQFVPRANDLRMFFTECDDFHNLTKEERKRLLKLADVMTGSGNKDVPCFNGGSLGDAYDPRIA